MGAARYLSFVRRLQRAPACWQRGSTMCTRASTSLAKGCLRQGAKNVRVSFVFCFCATARASYGLQNSAKFQSGTQMMDGCASVNEPVPRGTEHGTGEQGGQRKQTALVGSFAAVELAPPVSHRLPRVGSNDGKYTDLFPYAAGPHQNRGAKAVGAERVLGDKCCHPAWPFFLRATRDVASWRSGAD